jgi:hypothetical protein
MINRTWAAAAAPSVIGNLGEGFNVMPWGRATFIQVMISVGAAASDYILSLQLSAE